MYTFFEHTADIGLRVHAPDRKALLTDAALGLTAILVDNPKDVRPDETWDIDVVGMQIDYLLFDWLNEVLFEFNHHHRLLAGCELQLVGFGLHAQIVGEPYDPERHRLLREVKAVTYHRFRVEADEKGWLAEIVLDI